MSTLAKFMIVAVAAVSTQVMAAKDPFAAMEPIGQSQHGNMSNDSLKPLTIFNKDKDSETAETGIESKEVVKPKQNITESKKIAKQEASVAKAAQTSEGVSDSGKDVVESNSTVEKFLDEVTFSKGVNNALFQDGETD